MSSIFQGRTRARTQAIQLLFQADVQGVDVFDLLAGGDYALDEGPLEEYGATLARGVAKGRLAIDRLLSAVSHNWNLSRMPLVDRTIMAVAIYEMFGQDDVPVSVSIAEAVEVAKVYGTDDSSSFVNGVLGRVARLAEEHPGASIAELARIAEPKDAAEGTQADAAPEAPAAAPAADVARAAEPEPAVASAAAPAAAADVASVVDVTPEAETAVALAAEPEPAEARPAVAVADGRE